MSSASSGGWSCGPAAFEPYIYKTGLFDRAWPQFKAPIETHWKRYVNGEVSRDDAIKNVVAAIR